MKTAFVLLAAAGAAMSQSMGDLPACGQTCVGNMLSIAQEQFGCSAGDVVCYCGNQDFGYGIRDCSNAACNADDASKVIAYGATYCQQALSSVASSVSSVAAGASSTGAVGILTSELASVTGTPISTSALVGTATASDGSTFETTTGFSTIYASVSDSASSAVGSITSSAGSAISSAASSASDAASSAASSAESAASSAASRASDAASSVASEASSAVSSATGAAPMMTAFPMAGAAGIAAMLFL